MAKKVIAAPEDTFVPDAKKTYEFQLIQRYDDYQPSERGNRSVKLGNGFPPLLTIRNSGLAFDPSGNISQWRFITGQDSIWVKDQVSLEKASQKEIAFMLAAAENQLEFRRGNMLVKGYEKLKLQAMMLSDEFEGIAEQVQAKRPKYRMLNPEKMQKETLDGQYAEFYATRKAMECRRDQMLAFAYNLNIDITDQSEAGLKRIRSAFYAKAKENPVLFNKQFESPINQIKWLVFEGLRQGIISHGQIAGKVTFADTGTALFDINPYADAVTEIADRIYKKQPEAYKMYQQLKGLILSEQEEETAPVA